MEADQSKTWLLGALTVVAGIVLKWISSWTRRFIATKQEQTKERSAELEWDQEILKESKSLLNERRTDAEYFRKLYVEQLEVNKKQADQILSLQQQVATLMRRVEELSAARG